MATSIQANQSPFNLNSHLANPNETGIVSNVDNINWTTVTLARPYTSMVVITSPVYDGSTPAVAVRINNASGNSFDIRVDRTDGSTATIVGIDVHYWVVEEGVYTSAVDGITMEAVKTFGCSFQ